MDKFLDAIITFFKALFSKYKVEPIDEKQELVEITHIPAYNETNEAVSRMQEALARKGYDIKVDGEFGPKTKEVLSRFQKSIGLTGTGIPAGKTIEALGLKVKEPEKKEGIPWFWWAKQHEGKVETNSTFSKFMSGFWKFVGLPQFNTIAGNTFAWCGLFIASALISTNLSYQKDGAGAKNWDKYGQKIEWRVNGIPQGAIVRINSKGDCKSASGNHVTFANGDCTASDLLKSGATFSGYGGNQGNAAKISSYSVSKICSVRWPSEYELPKKVLKSVNCSNGKTDTNEKTTKVIYLQFDKAA